MLPHHLYILLPPTAILHLSAALRRWVRVHLPLAAGHGDIDEAPGVCDSLLRAALWGLLLLLGFDLRLTC